MSKMYKYPLSGIWSQNTQFSMLTPIYYSEVIAGQSINGSLRVKIISDSLIRAALNRVYFDVFVFYIPFRVLWDGWQDFIALGTGTVPTVADNWLFNYEGHPVADGATHTAWQRTTYNTVFNDVFRSNKQAAATLSASDPLGVLTRGRSFQNTLSNQDADPLPEGTVDTSGPTFAVDELKLAQVKQRTERLSYFFDNPTNQEYLQLLARLGVQAGWEIDDMPRMIGQYHARATFETVVATGDTSTASPSGFFSGHLQCKFRQKLIPEHGIIAGYLVPRIEIPIKGLSDIPLSQKIGREYYWVDGARQQPPVLWSNRYVDGTSNALHLTAPAWEDYRTSVSQMFASITDPGGAGVPNDNYAIVGGMTGTNISGMDEIRDYIKKVDSSDFWREFIGPAHLACMVEVSGSQRSPVPPRHLSI